MYLAGALGLPFNRVRIVKPYTGGAFRGRCGLIHGLEIFCCSCAQGRQTGEALLYAGEDFTATETRHRLFLI